MTGEPQTPARHERTFERPATGLQPPALDHAPLARGPEFLAHDPAPLMRNGAPLVRTPEFPAHDPALAA